MTDQKTSALPSIGMALAAVGVSALIGFAAVYVTVGGSDNATPTAKQEKSLPQTAKAKDKGGDLAAFVSKTPAAPLANVTFEDGEGKPKSLADFRGKTVLLNLWATWCAPCKAEMPSLDRLQGELGSDTFQVVALALDRKGTKAAQAFLDE
ncbi:MAG: TlpA family protein disulfide reductase, partial [Alphaproteobacteria bacterium]|nr:TlpA family protein disulfide reductase [Alphaproteobacteria bacterium]